MFWTWQGKLFLVLEKIEFEVQGIGSGSCEIIDEMSSKYLYGKREDWFVVSEVFRLSLKYINLLICNKSRGLSKWIVKFECG